MKTLHHGLHVFVLSLFVVGAIGYGFLTTIGDGQSEDLITDALAGHTCIQAHMAPSSVIYNTHSCSLCTDRDLDTKFGAMAKSGEWAVVEKTDFSFMENITLPPIQESVTTWLSQFIPDRTEKKPATERNEMYVYVFGE